MGHGWAFGHFGGSTTRTNRLIISLAGSTPTIEPAICPDGIGGGGGGGGGTGEDVENTSSLPMEQSSRSVTEPMLRLRELSLLS